MRRRCCSSKKTVWRRSSEFHHEATANPETIQAAWVRITYWINAVAVVLMASSGWQIYAASPIFPVLAYGFAIMDIALLIVSGLAIWKSVQLPLLRTISGFNDKVQALLFNPQQMAPTYPASMITRPFSFNAFYGIDMTTALHAQTLLTLRYDRRLLTPKYGFP